jgi:hypothetical protein
MDGVILEMYKMETEFFATSDGKALIGSSLFDYHSKKIS